MASGDQLKIAVFLLAGGGAFVVDAIRRMSRLRKTQDLARANIATAPQGLVELEGYALPFGPTHAGFRHDQLVYRKIQVQKYVRRRKNSDWETLYQEVRGNHFVLADGTGLARVDLAQAELELKASIHPYESMRPEARRRFYAEFSMKVAGLPSADPGGILSRMFSDRWRVLEHALIVGSPVYVTGTFRSDALGRGEYELPPRAEAFLEQIKALRRSPALRRRLLDVNMDGQVSEEEEVLGAVRLYGTSRPRRTDAPVPKVPFAGAVMSDSNHRVFVADCHQERLVHRLGAWNLLRVIGGAAMIAGGVVVLVFGI